MAKINTEIAKKQIGKGWHYFIDYLFEVAEEESIIIHDIKEKFGYFTVYYESKPRRTSDKFVSLANWCDEVSSMTCEYCGLQDRDKVRMRANHPHSWIKTLCKECDDKRAQKYEAIEKRKK